MKDKINIFNKDNTYVSISVFFMLSGLIFYIANITGTIEQNKTSIKKLNEKIKIESQRIREERKVSLDNINDTLMSIQKEQQFIRERIIHSNNQLKEIVYKISGKLDSFELILFKDTTTKKGR